MTIWGKIKHQNYPLFLMLLTPKIYCCPFKNFISNKKAKKYTEYPGKRKFRTVYKKRKK